MWAAHRTIAQLAAASLVAVVLAGCQQPSTSRTPTQAGINPADLVDADLAASQAPRAVMRKLVGVAERVREDQRPAFTPAKRSVLVLSGGGAYGAYPAGFLVGWTQTGTRPEFDVVTGVSTGALIAALAFLGPEFDCELEHVYTTLTTEEIYRKKRGAVRSLFSDSLADNTPLLRQIEALVTPENVARVAEEHRKGRRLYIGTTDLDGRRPVVWNLGAIATQGTPEVRDLICQLLLASAAIPAFFPPVSIPVEIDGEQFEERHIDGGVTQALFYRPPAVPPGREADPAYSSLYGSDMYILVAGKLYADPDQVKSRVLAIAQSSVSTLIAAQTRNELFKLYTASMLTGMNFKLSAIPQDFPAPKDSTEFDPAEMRRMFDEGVRQATSGTAWRTTPPGAGEGEVLIQRTGVRLTRSRGLATQPLPPP